MEIIKIVPQGLCKGVINAMEVVKRAAADPATKRPIYMLGSLVHNKNIVAALSDMGVVILEGKSHLEMLDEVESGTVVFTAHGVSEEVRRKAAEKGLDVIDATCREVRKSQELIKKRLDEGYLVFFFGTKNHPETEAILGLSPAITLISSKDEIASLSPYAGKLALAIQTTVSYLQARELYQALLNKYPQIELIEEVCNSTRIRQEAVIKAKGRLDLIIVIGDRHSNNTRMLKEVAETEAGIPAILVESIEDLKDVDLASYERIGVTAGASTPNAIVEEIMEKLPKGDFLSELRLEDYLSLKK